MTRESNIPLFLWIATALLAHLVWGGGANRLSRAFEETLDIRRFAVSVRKHVRESGGELEVALLDEAADPHEDDAVEKPPEQDSTDDPSEDDEPEAEPSRKDDEAVKDEQKPEPVPAEPEKATPKLQIKIEKKVEPELPKELPKVLTKKRIAVVQHVEDDKQEDNPNAEFIGDQANKVKEQTQARITSTDQNDKRPTPGGAHSGPTKNPGNSDESRVAQSEDRPGAADMAPSGDDAEKEEEPKRAASAAPPPTPGATAKAPGSDKGDPTSSRPGTQPAQKGMSAQKARPEVEAAPDLTNAPDGKWSVAEKRTAQAGQKARKKRKKRLPPMKGAGGANDILGLGALGTTQSGVNLNLTPQQALAAVGRDRLRKEKKLDSERRKSAHRGSWQSVGIERWRSAIENYVPGVKPGNQTALNTARVPFASYLNAVHNRLHPVFADSFLASLDSLPGSHPMNRPEIKTDLEIVLNQDDGRVVRMGVTRTSGVTAFDIAALESVMRAQPFGAPPKEIVSPDGNVYFHWEFYRNPYYACSTYFAHPYILKTAPKSAPPNVPPPSPFRPREAPPGDQRHGLKAPDGSWLEKRASLR